MWKVQKKVSVYMLPKWKENKGYILPSLLLSLTIFLILTPFLSRTISFFYNLDNNLVGDELSVENFFHLLQKEIYESDRIEVTSTGMLLYQDEENIIIRIDFYLNNIRRRVNFTGHEIILFDVSGIKIIQEPHSLLITIDTKEGNTFVRRLFTHLS
jgi:competence protein ComGF